MDELALARAELAQLQLTERMLIEQLLAVRVAIETQKSNISKLVEGRPSLINRLPIELLTRIFSFLLTSSGADEDPYAFFESLPIRRKNSAGVSRFWKDLILNTPSFWSDIGLTCDSDSKSLMTQLKRSCEHPLNITIVDPSEDTLGTLLDILIPSTNRWRSLRIEDVGRIVLIGSIQKFNRLEFPRLEDVSINLCNWEYPQFLSPARSPALRHLDLGQLYSTEDFVTTTTLTALSLSVVAIRDRSFFMRIPTQSLTTLVFADGNQRDHGDWVLERDSLHFPLLQRLVLDATYPYRFMDAIVTPQLEHFEYTHRRSDDFLGTFGSKFSQVRHFTCEEWGDLDEPVAHMLCQAFSGVRHASLHTNHINSFFMDSPPSDGLEPQTPVDSWESLERLSLICDDCEWSCEAGILAEWLTGRQESGRLSLHLQPLGPQDDYWEMEIEDFSRFYNKLRDCCVLDFKGLRLSRALSLTTDGGFLGVRAGDKHSIILNNWRELSLENMDLFLHLNDMLPLLKTAPTWVFDGLLRLVLILAGYRGDVCLVL